MKKYISVKYYPEKNNYSYIINVLFLSKNRTKNFIKKLKLNNMESESWNNMKSFLLNTISFIIKSLKLKT